MKHLLVSLIAVGLIGGSQIATAEGDRDRGTALYESPADAPQYTPIHGTVTSIRWSKDDEDDREDLVADTDNSDEMVACTDNLCGGIDESKPVYGPGPPPSDDSYTCEDTNYLVKCF